MASPAARGPGSLVTLVRHPARGQDATLEQVHGTGATVCGKGSSPGFQEGVSGAVHCY